MILKETREVAAAFVLFEFLRSEARGDRFEGSFTPNRCSGTINSSSLGADDISGKYYDSSTLGLRFNYSAAITSSEETYCFDEFLRANRSARFQRPSSVSAQEISRLRSSGTTRFDPSARPRSTCVNGHNLVSLGRIVEDRRLRDTRTSDDVGASIRGSARSDPVPRRFNRGPNEYFGHVYYAKRIIT